MSVSIAGATNTFPRIAVAITVSALSLKPMASFAMVDAVAGAIIIASAQSAQSICHEPCAGSAPADGYIFNATGNREMEARVRGAMKREAASVITTRISV